MQGTEYYEGEEHEQCVRDWLAARDAAVTATTSFKLPVTKQLRNRILEPFMWHTVIVTATDYENFFALRAHKDAEIHIERLAYCMLEAYNASEPKRLLSGQWHIPFGDKMDEDRVYAVLRTIHGDQVGTRYDFLELENEARRKISIARCARLSYQNYEGKDDYLADIKLCDRLFGATPRHLSPTEHVAQCMEGDEFIGNFSGWCQHRYKFNDQNLKDSRVVKKGVSS